MAVAQGCGARLSLFGSRIRSQRIRFGSNLDDVVRLAFLEFVDEGVEVLIDVDVPSVLSLVAISDILEHALHHKKSHKGGG